MAPPAKGYPRTPQPGDPARSEAWALLEAARKLNQAKDASIDEFRSALRANWRLWTIFQASLIEPDCPLPNEVRGNLLGLANFIDRTTVELLAEREPTKIAALVNINRQISEGLMEGARAKAAAAAASPTVPTPVTPASPTAPVNVRQSA
jgi:flagellar protein FlaF